MTWPNYLISLMRTPITGSTGELCDAAAEGANLIPLNRLRLDQCGLIQRLDLNETDDKRLRTMGICPGRLVWLVRRGDPMILKVMGTRIGLAADLAQQVTVQVCAPPSKAAPKDSQQPQLQPNPQGPEK